MALLDNGAQINTIMPKYVSDHSLQMGLITDLLGAKVTCIGLGNAYTRPLGYIVIWVQVNGVQGYNEDQVALVIPDLSNFAAQIPVILGAPTISCIVNAMREKEIDALAMPWVNTRVAHLLSVHRMAAVKMGDEFMLGPRSDDYDEVVFTWNVETIEAFSSHAVQVRVERAHTSGHINIMTWALWAGDGSLSQGLTVQNVYTELRQGSKNALVVVRNSMAYPQTLLTKTPVARAVVANPVLGLLMESQLQEGEDKPHDPHTPKLTVRQRRGKLFDKLDLSGLDSWLLELADAVQHLMAEYHDVFSLDPAELGCTHSTEHIIKVTDDTPFKEQFRWIPMPLVKEVQNHL